MNSPRETPETPAADRTDATANSSGIPNNWREALTTLVATRASLVRLEAKQCARNHAGLFIRGVIAALSVLFGWMLLLAGGVAAIASLAGWPWHWVALAAAALHLLLALILARTFKAGPPAFQATLAEFQKDREWIENFQRKPKSSN